MSSEKVFFVTSQDMFDMYGNGGAKGSQKCLSLLRKYYGKNNVFLCAFGKTEDLNEDTVVFKRIHSQLESLVAALCGCKIYLPWQERKIVRFIKKYNPDILFVDTSILGRLVKYKNIARKTIVFFYNVESDYALNKVKNEGVRFLPSFWSSKYNDKCGISADKIICINERDSKRLYELYGRKADILIPVSFYDAFDKKKTVDNYKRSILFCGSLFTPNQISIEWFIKEVMPMLDNISLDIVGKGFEKKKEEYERNKNVNVIGSVAELDEYYYQHAAVVIPLIIGAGMKVKTAEAMMYGRIIFASDEALEGYDVEGVEGIFRCNTADEYAKAINSYFSQEKFQMYQKAVREKFLEKYETSIISESLNQFLDRLFEEEIRRV